VSDQTPEARLAAALPISVIDHATEHDVVVRGRYTLDASMMRERLVAGMTAADPTLAADLALAAAVRRLEGYWTVEHVPVEDGWKWQVTRPDGDMFDATTIAAAIKAAKEAER